MMSIALFFLLKCACDGVFMRQPYTRGTNLLREHGLIPIPHSLPCQQVLSCPYMGFPDHPPPPQVRGSVCIRDGLPLPAGQGGAQGR